MLEARNFREANDSIPVTPFLLCKNLDIATLLDPEGQPLRTADRDSSIWKRFGKHLDRYNLRKVRPLPTETCTLPPPHHSCRPVCSTRVFPVVLFLHANTHSEGADSQDPCILTLWLVYMK